MKSLLFKIIAIAIIICVIVFFGLIPDNPNYKSSIKNEIVSLVWALIIAGVLFLSSHLLYLSNVYKKRKNYEEPIIFNYNDICPNIILLGSI